VTSDPIERYRRAIETGSSEALAAWAKTAREGLDVLLADLTGRRRVAMASQVQPRDAIDNMTAAVAAIAGENPATFLDVFADEGLDDDTYVLVGLGQIDDPRATRRLIRAAGSRNAWARMEAAIGLGRRRPSAVGTAALVKLLADSEYLVRHHALEALERAGDMSALDALRGFEPPTKVERTKAVAAVSAIDRRATRRQPSG
jgi:HEAT repeat protein